MEANILAEEHTAHIACTTANQESLAKSESVDKVKHNANEEIQTSQTNTHTTIAGNGDKQSELAETVLAFEQKLALIKEFKNQVFSQIKPVK